jgi:hypothetical protein
VASTNHRMVKSLDGSEIPCFTLAFQYSREINMDGFSGINVDMCHALREL